jgi:chromosome segregation ATPase
LIRAALEVRELFFSLCLLSVARNSPRLTLFLSGFQRNQLLLDKQDAEATRLDLISDQMKKCRTTVQSVQNELSKGRQTAAASEAVSAAVREWRQKYGAGAQASPQQLADRLQQAKSQAKEKLRAAISAISAAAAVVPPSASPLSASTSGSGSGGVDGAVQRVMDEAERALDGVLQAAATARSECARTRERLSALSAPKFAGDEPCFGDAVTPGVLPSVSGSPLSPDSKSDPKCDGGSAGAVGEAKSVYGGSAFSITLQKWQRQMAQCVRDVQRLSRRWREASASRERAVQTIGSDSDVPGAAAAASGAGQDSKDEKKEAVTNRPSALVNAVRDAMLELSDELQYQQPRLEHLLSAVLQRVKAEQTEHAKQLEAASAEVMTLVSEYSAVTDKCAVYAQSLASLRVRYGQYHEWLSVFHSRPPRDKSRRLAVLKAELEHAEDEKERSAINEQIAEVDKELREYRVRWRAARDRLTECMHSGYFAALETDDTLKYMLLPDR